MIKFLLILIIFTKIIEINCVGENDAGPSKKDNGKRNLDEYLEQNASNSKEFSQKSIKIPKHQIDLNKTPDDGFDWFNEENVQHSSSAQLQRIEQNMPLQRREILEDDDELKIISLQQMGVSMGHKRRRIKHSERGTYQSALAKEDLMELVYPNKLVNNRVIDAYLELLTKKNFRWGYIPTYVVKYFRENGRINPVWFQSITVEHLDKINYWLIPAHLNGDHWALAAFEVPINWMTFYDSLNPGIVMESKNLFRGNMLSFFKMLYQEKSGSMPFDPEETEWFDMDDMPRQGNGIDCGVFLMMFAKDIINQGKLLPKMTVSQEKIYECRLKIFNELRIERFKSEEFHKMIQDLQQIPSPLPLAKDNLSNRESATNIEQVSQFNKGKAPIIGTKRPFYDTNELLLKENPLKADHKIYKLNIESQNNQNEKILSSPTQQQMMDRNKSKDHWNFAIENPIIPEEFLEFSTINDDLLYSTHTQQKRVNPPSQSAFEGDYVDRNKKIWPFRAHIGKNISHKKLRAEFGFTESQENEITINLFCRKKLPNGGRCTMKGIYLKSNGCLYTRGEHEYEHEREHTAERGKIPQNIGDNYVDREGKEWQFHMKIDKHILNDELWYRNFGFSTIHSNKSTSNLNCQKHSTNGGKCPFKGIYLKENGCLYIRGKHEHI